MLAKEVYFFGIWNEGYKNQESGARNQESGTRNQDVRSQEVRRLRFSSLNGSDKKKSLRKEILQFLKP
jgi:hypothetical protein